MRLQRYLPELIAAVFVGLAVILAMHQRFFTNDGWFHFRQVVHFETIIACCIAGAIAVVAGKYIGKSGK